ncbi:MAG TPA: hypothetical protein VFZ41_06185 [Solirubrobacterales bacterium]
MPRVLIASVRRFAALTSIAACLALVPLGSAGAATVVNGDFETGDLSGWQVNGAGLYGSGGVWFASEASDIPPECLECPPPPQGNFAALGVTIDGRQILYQDIALDPYHTHELSLTAYYVSLFDGIRAPNTLDPKPVEFAESEFVVPNQQYRIDVMSPTAALDSLDPADILATVFANKTGDAVTMAPTQLGANLTPFAGQTVRLRMAAVGDRLLAGVDAVSIASTSLPPSNRIRLGKPKRNKRRGTAKVPVTVFGPGTLVLSGKGVIWQIRRPAVAGTVKMMVRSEGKKKKQLNATGRVKVKARFTFRPTGGTPNSKSKRLILRKRLR